MLQPILILNQLREAILITIKSPYTIKLVNYTLNEEDYFRNYTYGSEFEYRKLP